MEGTKKRLIISAVLTNMFRSVLALSPGAALFAARPAGGLMSLAHCVLTGLALISLTCDNPATCDVSVQRTSWRPAI